MHPTRRRLSKVICVPAGAAYTFMCLYMHIWMGWEESHDSLRDYIYIYIRLHGGASSVVKTSKSAAIGELTPIYPV